MSQPVFVVSHQVLHKPDCKVTEDGKRIEISDLGLVEGLYYLCNKTKGADQLCGYRTADLHLCFEYAK